MEGPDKRVSVVDKGYTGCYNRGTVDLISWI